MKYKRLLLIKSTLLLFIIGSVIHFLYDLSGKNIIVGLFTPVNESVWEHSKMVLLPTIFWWSIYYIKNHEKMNIDKRRWFTGALVALIVASISIPLLYYFYSKAFGLNVLAIDIFILFLALLFGQSLGFHFYKHSKGINLAITIFIIIGIILIFAVFTINPPHLPLFKDGPTGSYGIF